MKRKLKRTLTSFVAVVILMSTLLSSALFTVNAVETRVLRNLTWTPDLSVINKNIKTYSICFRCPTNVAGENTYWSLANFGFVSEKTGDRFGGGYAGLQMIYNSEKRKQVPVVILSMFMSKDGTYPKCMYSMGKSNYIPSDYAPEPGCNNIVEPYAWRSQQWYRMVLHCWDDAKTKTTMVGMWMQDMSTEEWTLVGYYDTRRPQVALTAAPGDMHFFMEDLDGSNSPKTESYQLSGIYAKDTADGKWKAIVSGTMSFNGKPDCVRGGVSMSVVSKGKGLDNNYFQGTTNQYLAVPNNNCKSGTIKPAACSQNNTPDFGQSIRCSGYEKSQIGNDMYITLYLNPYSAPMLSYEFLQYDKNGKNPKKIASTTNPSAKSGVLKDVYKNKGKVELRLTDIFGNTSTYVVKTAS